METIAAAAILIYAAVLVIGGVVGWRLSGSRMSFTASLTSAALLTIAYRLSYSSSFGGYLMATIVSLALGILFAARFRKTGKFLPAGMMLLVSLVVVILLGWAAALSW